MKPADHPEFFRFPAPEGRSRESSIVLKADGHFEHDGAPVEHRKLEQAMHTWVSRHPDDGRYILTNGYDWTYLTVEDAPFFVRHLLPAEDVEVNDETPVTMVLSDGSSEVLDPGKVTEGADGALYTWVKAGAPGGPYEAKFTRHAQTSLARFLRGDGAIEHGAPGAQGGDDGDSPLLNHARFAPKARDISPKK